MEPKYQQIANALRRDIAIGVFQDGQALWTEDALARKFDASRQTVRQAIAVLESDGLIVRRRGSGNYVTHGPRKHGSLFSVGVITTYITDYIFPSIVRGIESVLSTENCLMSLSATYNNTERERALLERFLSTPVDGLIIEGTKTAIPNPNICLYERLRERNIPYVFINGYYPQLTRSIHVIADDAAGGRQAVDTLTQSGHRRIMGIFKSDDMQGPLRYQGFAAALQSHGFPLRAADVCWFTTENRHQFLQSGACAAFMDGLVAYADAVVCYNDEIALALLEELQQRGVSVPEQISLISFDNSAYAGICNPKLTSFSHPKDEFGRTAALKLMNVMRGNREDSTVLPWELIRRESVGGRER